MRNAIALEDVDSGMLIALFFPVSHDIFSYPRLFDSCSIWFAVHIFSFTCFDRIRMFDQSQKCGELSDHVFIVLAFQKFKSTGIQ